MRILAIETSCDETGIAVVRFERKEPGSKAPQSRAPQVVIESDLLASQIETHRPYGGVVPGVARREHEKNLPVLFEEIREKLEPDIIAVTVGPGLSPCLWSGITFAKEIHGKYFPKAKLVGANHLEGHLYSFLLSEAMRSGLEGVGSPDLGGVIASEIFPAIHLLVSGGHTMLMLMRSLTEWEVLGQTKDDAAGEAFDKVARLLELPYPGGPEIERLAVEPKKESGSKAPQSRTPIIFPAPMMHSDDYDFSYSGLKTAVLYYLRDHPEADKAAVARAFQEAAFGTLVAKTKRAAEEFKARSIMLSGGVAANKALQEKLRAITRTSDVGGALTSDVLKFFVAPPKYNTDNAVIIALAAYIAQTSGKEYRLEAQPNLGL